MKYDFDKIIDRSGTNAMSLEGYEDYLFEGENQLKIPCEKEDIIRMWVADMEFQTSQAIIDQLQHRIQHGIFGYTQRMGAPYIDAFLSWTKTRYNWEFAKEHLVSAKGVIPALFNLIKYICKPYGKVLITTPSYAFFKHAADFNGVPLVCSDLVYDQGDYAMDFDDLASKLSDPKVSLFILCNPHNPTGKLWSDDDLKTLGKLCLTHDVFIIADEIHCDILRVGKRFTPMAKLFPESDKIITCMSASKTFNLAGFMFANIVIPNKELRTKWLVEQLPIENPLSLAATYAAYSEGEEWLSQMTVYLDKNFDFVTNYLDKHLPKAIHQIPDGMYLMWIDLSSYFEQGENLTLFFANNAGVLLEGGNMFVDNADGFIRLNLACPRAKVEEGLKRICKAVLDH